MKETNRYTSDEKKLWWGYGEWCEEPDLVEFEHCGFKCIVFRQASRETCEEFHMSGGHLTGYVAIDKDHTFYGKDAYHLYLDVHGGITFAEIGNEELFFIGFDCAHAGDITPSMEMLKKKYSNEIYQVPEQFKHLSLFNPTYKNIAFAVGECKYLAEQLKNALNEKH